MSDAAERIALPRRRPESGRPRRVATALLAAVCVVATAQAAIGAALDLPRALRGALSDARLGEAKVGYIVVDLETDEILASHNEDEQFIPASNMKLLTSGAALAVLGPDFEFETEVRVDGDTIIVRGSGDPALADGKLLERMGIGVDEFIDVWVKALAEDREEPYESIIIDDRIFDADAVHPTWPRDQLNRWYCAEVWGLNFHANLVALFASPARSTGLSPEVRAEPEIPWLNLQNLARTVKKGSNTLWVARPPKSNALKLRGNIRAATYEPVEVTLTDMPLLLGRLMRDRLEKRGLGAPRVRRASPDETLPDGRVVSVVRTPMEIVLERCNTDSYNLYAEALIKRIGHEITGLPGSWATGASAVRMLVKEYVGAREAASVVIADGSGMSRGNRLTPEAVAGWLEAMYEREVIRQPFLDSLASPRSSGTLRRRFRSEAPEHEVRAKTGYLNGVSSLSGFVKDNATGRTLVFSVLINDIPRDLPFRRVKDFQEEVVLFADDWLDTLVAGVSLTED